MIYEDFEVLMLEPVRYELADIKSKKTYKKAKAIKREQISEDKQVKEKKVLAFKKVRPDKKNISMIDMLIRNCFICFLILAVFTVFNIVGFDTVIENLKNIAENRSLGGIYTNANFM